MPESNVSLILFVYYNTVNENSTNNVPVSFFTSTIWMLKGKSPLFTTVAMNESNWPYLIEFNHQTVL